MRPFFFALFAFAFTVRGTAQAKALHLLKTIAIPGNGSWDYLAVQPSSSKLFVSHGTEVAIVNKETGDSIGTIKGLDGVHGIAFVPGLNKGYITSGRSNAVVVFDLTNNNVITKIEGGENPDAIFYEAGMARIVVCNGKSRDLTLIDPATDKAVKRIPVDGRPEVAVSNGTSLFVNLEDKNEIAVISLADFTVRARWPLKPDEAPTGMAIDRKARLLFTACSETAHLLVMDATTGKIKQRLPIGEDCDGVYFDEGAGCIYASNRGGTLTVMKKERGIYVVKEALPTKYGAKTITVDEQTHKVYLPAATLQKGGDEEKPKILPGTFGVLVYGY